MSLNYKQNDELIPLYQSGVSPNQMDNTETDANDCVPIDTDIKVYRVGNSATNIPIQQAGIIETFVYRDSGNVRVTQRYTVNYNTSGTPTFSRTAIGDDNSLTWSEWSTFDNYSTDEQVVGRWIDGKPIYKKTISTNTSTTANQWIYITEIISNNIKNFVKIEGICNVNTSFIPLPYGESNSQINIVATDSKIRCNVTNTAYLNKPCVIIVQYTKTTD